MDPLTVFLYALLVGVGIYVAPVVVIGLVVLLACAASIIAGIIIAPVAGVIWVIEKIRDK